MNAEFVSLGWGFEADAKRYVATLFPRMQVSIALARSRQFALQRTNFAGSGDDALHRLLMHEKPAWPARTNASLAVEVETPWLTPRALEAYLIFTYPQWFRLAV